EPLTGEYSSPAAAPAAPPLAAADRNWLVPAVAAGIVIVVAAAVLVMRPLFGTETPSAAQAVRFEVGESEKMKFFYGGAMAVSPDGHWMVFPARGDDGVNRYWVRSLDTVEARALPGTETAYVPPAWTWDSRQVIFTVLSNNKLHKVDI